MGFKKVVLNVLVVGQNPSPSAEEGSPAFEGSMSWPRLQSWLRTVGDHRYFITNASWKKGRVSLKDADKNLPELCSHFDAVITLGTYASRVVQKMELGDGLLPTAIIPMPHPSGLNRLLNDPAYVTLQLSYCKNRLKMVAFLKRIRKE